MTSMTKAWIGKITYPRGDDLGDAEGPSRCHLVLGLLVPERLGAVGRAGDLVIRGMDGGLALEVGVRLVDRLRLALEVGRGRGVGEVCGE